MVVNQNSVMSVVKDFILMAVKLKQQGDCSQRFSFNSSGLKQRSERTQIFHFNSSEVKWCSD